MDYIKGILADAFLVSMAVAGFVVVACTAAVLDWILSIWRASVPDDVTAKSDEQYAASIEHFPMGYMTFIIALVGVIGCAAIVAWGL